MHQLALCLCFFFAIFICLANAQTSRYNWTKPDELNIGLPPTAEIFTLN